MSFEEGDRVVAEEHTDKECRGKVVTWKGSIYDVRHHDRRPPGYIFVAVDSTVGRRGEIVAYDKPFPTNIESFYCLRMRKLNPIEALAELASETRG